MLIRGQLVLNINLKQKQEVKQAISLLEAILVEDNIAEIRKQISAGTWVTTEKLKPVVMKAAGDPRAKLKPFPVTIEEEEKLLKDLDPKEFKKYYDETYIKKPTVADLEKLNSDRKRTNKNLKYAYNQYGRFPRKEKK